jgi:hypothetical protein
MSDTTAGGGRVGRGGCGTLLGEVAVDEVGKEKLLLGGKIHPHTSKASSAEMMVR